MDHCVKQLIDMSGNMKHLNVLPVTVVVTAMSIMSLELGGDNSMGACRARDNEQ
jgi:hypothetical protein